MAANTIPTVSTLPPAPTRADAPADFTAKADTLVASLPGLVTQVNLTVKGMNDQASYLDQLKADVNGYKNSAAQSVTDAANQVSLATTQASNAKAYADNAKSYRDSAQTYSAAAQSAVGAPSLTGHAGDFLGVNSDEKGVSWQPGIQTGFQEFTVSTTFPKPDKAKWLAVELVGAGAGGSWTALQTSSSSTSIAPGGDGGNYNFRIFRASELDTSIPINVGIGGTGGTSSSPTGAAGTDSSFGSYLVGKGAKAANSTAIVSPSLIPDHSWFGGLGARPLQNSGGSVFSVSNGSSSIKGGGGGAGSGSYNSSMFLSTPGNSQDAGNGGVASNSTSQPGGDGVFPGGGGAGSSGGTRGGKGAGGRIRVWWW